jgi:hypothetical protein
VTNVEDWAEIRRLQRVEPTAIKAIARCLGVVRKRLGKHCALTPPHYERADRRSAVDAFNPATLELLAELHTMPATVIADRVRSVCSLGSDPSSSPRIWRNR